MRSRPVAALARRTALIVASVPELTKRTISIDGTIAQTSSAIWISACVGAPKEEIDEIARRYWEAGVRHIVALRGDPQDGSEGYRPTPGGYPYAADLVAGLAVEGDMRRAAGPGLAQNELVAAQPVQ